MDTEKTSEPVKISACKYALAVLSIVLVIVLLVIERDNKVIAVSAASISAVLVVAKQILSTFARDNVKNAKKLEDAASLVALFAVVLAAPTVFAALMTIAG